MGTINYMTSDILTLATPVPYDYNELEAQAEEIAAEIGGDTRDIMYRLIRDMEDDDRANAEEILRFYRSDYYPVKLEPGYYEGLQLVIDAYRPEEYDDEREKYKALAELEELAGILEELAGIGFMETFPGWGTSYSNYQKTIEAIRDAIEAEKAEIIATPIWGEEEETA